MSAYRLVARLGRFFSALFDGVALGLLDDKTLRQLDYHFYSKTKEWCDRTYNQQGLAHWEQDCVDKYFHAHSPVLITAVGGGREAIALELAGFKVTAYECHDELRAFANSLLQELGRQCRVLPINRDEAPEESPGSIANVLVGWGSYMLIPRRSSRIELLQALGRILRPDGVVLLSFFYSPTYGRPLRLTFAVANMIRTILRRELVELGDSLNFGFVHYFTESSIRAEVESAGLRVEMIRGQPYGHCVARRVS